MEQNTFQTDPLKSILQEFPLDDKEPVIGILRRNPFQVFVYWELPKLKKREEYFLRIIDCSEKKEWRIISLVKIDINSSRCYINIPPEVKSCEAELIAKSLEGEEKVLISTIKDKKMRDKIVAIEEENVTSHCSAPVNALLFCEIQKISGGSEREKDKIKIPSSWSGKRV